ncbi:MAG: efflux RND transporter periplasmic adaptor subunit [Candidatus Hydrogenedentes bacterium]|nr:efflux RND transporter periplasmic adaptor subunit [Candidatus Hydrogenedentota bacterium]
MVLTFVGSSVVAAIFSMGLGGSMPNVGHIIPNLAAFAEAQDAAAPQATQPPTSPPPTGGQRKILYYKSTMMPGEISQTPRKDSMGMDMVPVYEGEETTGATIVIDPVTQQNMGIRTAPVARGPLRKNIRTVGFFAYDETTLVDVTTRFAGWIERLYVNTTGTPVKEGEPLFSIYSPDLYRTQYDYVIAANAASKAPSITTQAVKQAALQKLSLLDISENQIRELEKTNQPQRAMVVYAPRAGIVVEKAMVQGARVDAGQRVYQLADLSTVWLMAQIYEADLPFIREGQDAAVTLPYSPGRRFRGKLAYIYPTLDEKTRTAQVRLEFDNPEGLLKPGMYANLEITSELAPSVMLVPSMAVLRSGERNTVFVALEGGKFDPREVTLGARADNNAYEVLSGLNDGEVVVTSGQFMLDSESQLREAIQKMLEPKPMAEPASPNAPPAEEPMAPMPQSGHGAHGM